MQSTSGPVCQSCGIPMNLDNRGGGTEADGSKSVDYCSHCYLNGQFIHPVITMAQMANTSATRMREMAISESHVQRAVGAIPSLKRWKKTPQP